MDKVIRYRFMEDRHGDQPFFNVALYNSDLDINTLNHIGHLGFSLSNYDSFKNLDKVLIHYNIGVGYTSKLDLMKETWAYINRI